VGKVDQVFASGMSGALAAHASTPASFAFFCLLPFEFESGIDQGFLITPEPSIPGAILRENASSNHFARSAANKFIGLDVEAGPGGVPLLKDCASRLQCKTAFKYEGGDHVIFVGEVLRFDRRDVAPLVFQGGQYALAARKAEPALLSGNTPRESDVSFGEDFLGYLLWRAHQHFRHRVVVHLQAHGLDPDSFMILAMLLHRDARTPKQLASSMLPTAGDGFDKLLATVVALGLVSVTEPTHDAGPQGAIVRLTAKGREVTLLIHAASKAIETDLLGRLDTGEALAFKHLIRRFIVQTDPGLPHPWQDAT